MSDRKKCRLCLCECFIYESLLSENGVQIVKSLTSIEISSSDKFPLIACTKCWLNIKLAYTIQQNILESDRKLRATSMKPIIKEESLSDEDLIEEIQCEVIIIKGEEPDETYSAECDLVAKEIENSIKILHKICKICGQKVQDASMEEHIKNHFNCKQECDCGAVFDNIQLFKEHFTVEHSDLQQTWCCNKCFLTFHYKSIYNVHMKSAHIEVKKVVSTLSKKKRVLSAKNSVQDIMSPESLNCEKCKKNFTSEELYFRHLKQHGTKKCPICKADITRYNFLKHVRIHSAGPSICHLCGVTCKNFDSLRGHLYYTHSKNKFPCDVCGQVFKKSYSRILHIRKEHTGEKNYTCETCGKAFFTNYYLMKHIKMTHLKLRPYICQHCNKGFSSKFALKTHERQHTNDAPYRCDMCGDGFRQNVSLRAHKKTKHNIIEEKTCVCKVCGKAFASDWAVKSHMRLH